MRDPAPRLLYLIGMAVAFGLAVYLCLLQMTVRQPRLTSSVFVDRPAIPAVLLVVLGLVLLQNYYRAAARREA
jgi:hypothetical protein